MSDQLFCRDERRREQVRAAAFNGLDYLEMSDDQRVLSVYFLGKAPEHLVKENVRIEGGRRIREIRVVDLEIHRNPDPELDDSTHITVDRPGDFSTYTLRLVDLDEQGRATERPLTGFDPRYARLEFSFKAGCESHVDCKPQEICPPEARAEPEISYLAKDYASFRQLIFDRLALVMPDWKERHVPDLGVALVELFAYVGDYLSCYQDAVATEAYLGTARRRTSVRRHTRLVDYPMHEGCNARAWVHVESDADVDLTPGSFFFVTPYGDPDERQVTRDDVRLVPPQWYEAFEPLLTDTTEPVRIRQAHSRVSLYTWGDRECCLARGATAATLLDGWQEPEPEPEEPYPEQGPYRPGREEQESPAQAASGAYGSPKEEPEQPPRERLLDLRPGDVLIFEEVLGPVTGQPADADPAHRHAVRLTRVEPEVDPLNDQPVVEITWSEEDALPFPLCLSAIGPPPECELLEISVARGNVVLCDHGRTVDEEAGTVPEIPVREVCTCGCPHEVESLPGRFRPLLNEAPMTFSEPLPPEEGLGADSLDRCLRLLPAGDEFPSAARMVAQDPRLAGPAITLIGRRQEHGHEVVTHWEARRDLLGSDGRDRHFVAEVDDEGRARLRFGDGELGRAPAAGTNFVATYRVGNGPAGNVGADTIRVIVLEALVTGVNLRPRNPLPARGGTAPEPVPEVKMFAPHAFRAQQHRAVSADDYARLAGRFCGVQRAAAVLRWTGSWQEALVAVDPAGSLEAEHGLLRSVRKSLHPYRRMGHDLAVRKAQYVPLQIALEVCVLPDYIRGHVRRALLDVFSNRRLPSGRLGFFHPDNLTFGEGVAVSRIVAAAQAVEGVESVRVLVLQRQFEAPNQELETGLLELGPLEVARLDNDPNLQENGVITFDVRGGR